MNETDRHGYDLPDPPENLSFLELPEDFQETVADRFARGIAKNERALYEARERERMREGAYRLRVARRAQAVQEANKRAFNPVLRGRT